MTEYYPQTKESWSESSFGRVSWADLEELGRETGGRGPVCWRSNQAVVPGKGRWVGTQVQGTQPEQAEVSWPSPARGAHSPSLMFTLACLPDDALSEILHHFQFFCS